MKRLILISILFIITLPIFSTNYYVKNSGSDSNTGLSDAQAWATISKVNAQSFSPGDIIYFNCGDTWRETLEIPSSGTSDLYITFSRYGTGANPRILGSNLATTWTNTSGNIWRTTTTFTDPRSINDCDIHFLASNGTHTWGTYVSGTASLTSEYQWTASGGYIYVYAASDPSTRYASVEIPQRIQAISTNDHQYLKFTGIDVAYTVTWGYDTNNDHGDNTNISGCIVEYADVGFVGGTITSSSGATGLGLQLVYSDLIIRHCTIHNCGRRGISLDVYGSGFTASNALIEDNTFYGGYHTTAMDVNTGSNSYTGGWDGIIFRRNLVYEPDVQMPNVSNQIFLQRYNSTTLQNIYIYSNIFKGPTNHSVHIERANYVFIYNNDFYQFNSYNRDAQVYMDTSPTNIVIKNNIFYSTITTDGYSSLAAPVSSGVVTADYNCYYRVSNTPRIINQNGTVYYMNSSFPTSYGWESHGYKANPLFTDASNGDFTLTSSSTIKASGTPLTVVETDYNGNSFDATNPSIGALQYGTVTVVVPTVITTSVSNIMTTTATGGGNVTSNGGASITARGICWNTTGAPTIANSHTSDGTSTGTYSSALTSLSPGTTYYVRSYATNSAGTAYGSQVSFTTLSASSYKLVKEYGGHLVKTADGTLILTL